MTPRIPRRAPGISSRQRPSVELRSVRPQQGYSQSAVHRPERARGDVGSPTLCFTHPPSNGRARIPAALLRSRGAGEEEEEEGRGGSRSVSSHNPNRSFFLPHAINSKTLPRDTGWQKENQLLRGLALRHPGRVYFSFTFPGFFAGKGRLVSLGYLFQVLCV